MRTSAIRNLFFSATLFFCMVAGVQADQSGELNSVDLKTRFITVDELTAEFHTDSNSITVSAQIRNVSSSIIRGYATIYFLTSEGQEIYSYQEEVNSGEPFGSGSIVDFESTTLVRDIKKIGSISVDFTQK